MYAGEKVEEITPAQLKAPQASLFAAALSSVPKLDPSWLDALEQDPELVQRYGQH